MSQDIDPEIEELMSSRRRLLTRGAAAAAVATVAGLAMSKETLAINGDNIKVGNTTTGDATTTVNGGTTFRVVNGKSTGINGVQGSILGTTNVTSDAGVIGENTSTTSGIGVYGFNAASSVNGYGVLGSNRGDNGIGVFGVHSTEGGSTGVGVWAQTNKGNGLVARGTMYDVVASGNGKVLFGAASFTNPPTPGASTPGTTGRDADGNLWYSPSSGVYRKLSGPAVAGAFHALPPGRVYDSRQTLPSPGPLAAGANRTISVADRRDATLSTGAVVEANFVPAGATAVSANVTITGTVGAGFLTVNPGGNTTVGASTINWKASDQDIANGIILTLNANRELTIIAGGGGSTGFIIDINGYFL